MGKRFSPKRNLNKANIAKTTNNKPAVYKLKNAKGENVYTGVAKRGRVQERLREHMASGSDRIPGTATFSVKPHSSVEKAKAEEKRIIKNEKPKHNKTGK